MNKNVLKQRSSLLSIFLTFGMDNLGATIIFPIFAPLFLEPAQKLFSSEVSLAYKTVMLGIFLGIFPLMQFFVSPILGEYADHHGRKKALILTTFLTFIGYGLSTLSLHYHFLLGIFISRLIMGIGAGNLSICLSSLADLSHGPAQKVRYFSYGSAIAGLTFILGPFVGGKLSDPKINPLFNASFPMLVGTVLAFFNILFILLGFSETLQEKSKEKFDFIKGIHSIQMVLKLKEIKNLYLIYFFYLFSWNIIFLFVPAFVVQKFYLSNSNIGDICALMGGFWIFGTSILYRLLHKMFSSKRILFFSFVFYAMLILIVPFISVLFYFIVILGIGTLFAGLIWPICTGNISNTAPVVIQGKILGLSQSMLSLTMMLASIIGGIFLNTHVALLFALAALSSLIAFFILFRTNGTAQI